MTPEPIKKLIETMKAAINPDERPTKRKALNRAIKDCRRALNSVKALGKTPTLAEELRGFIHQAEEQVRRPASTGDRASALRKQRAVEITVDVMLNFGDRMPTVGAVSEAAATMMKIVTGKEPSNMDEYTSRLFRKMEAGGFPDAKARRRLDRDGERAACDKLRENLMKYSRLWPPH